MAGGFAQKSPDLCKRGLGRVINVPRPLDSPVIDEYPRSRVAVLQQWGHEFLQK